jgi:hypothetical protein
MHAIAPLLRSASSTDAMPASPFVTFLLRSLKHPRPHDMDPDDPMQFQETVVWLEGSRIRHYKEGERAALQHGDPQMWQAALQKYLIDVECPIEFDGANRSAVLHWLLTHAGERRLQPADRTCGPSALACSHVPAARQSCTAAPLLRHV